MFARISIYENVDLDLADQVKQWVESLGTDPFGELPAYAADARADRDGFRDLVGGRIDPRDGAVGAVTDPHPAAASSPRRVVVSVDPTRSVNITVVMLLVRVLLTARCADFPTPAARSNRNLRTAIRQRLRRGLGSAQRCRRAVRAGRLERQPGVTLERSSKTGAMTLPSASSCA